MAVIVGGTGNDIRLVDLANQSNTIFGDTDGLPHAHVRRTLSFADDFIPPPCIDAGEVGYLFQPQQSWHSL